MKYDYKFVLVIIAAIVFIINGFFMGVEVGKQQILDKYIFLDSIGNYNLKENCK